MQHGFTPEREAAALTFVRQHHPELAELLAALKTKDVKEYSRAIHDLFRTSERLTSYREKYPDRHEAELAAWQIKSRIQLLATQLRLVPDDPKRLQQLRKAVLEQVDVRIRLLEQERRRMAERLDRLDEQIRTMSAEREPLAEKQYQMLIRMPHKKPLARQEPPGAVKDPSKRPRKEKDKDSGSRKPN